MKQELQLTDIQISAIKLIAKETSRDLETVLSLIISNGISYRFGEFADYRITEAEKLADEIKEECDYRLGLIKENTPKEDTIYSLVDGTNKKSIVNGNTWNESEVKNND